MRNRSRNRGIFSLFLIGLLASSNIANAANFYISFPNNIGADVLKYTYDGKAITDEILIQNNDDSALNVSLYATDSLRTTDGNTGFKTQNQKQKNIGKWIQFLDKEININGKQNAKIEFTIDPSLDIQQPGTYIGGIAIQSKNNAINDPSKSGTAVKVLTRNIQKILITIPGEVTNSYKAIDLAASSKLSFVDFNYGIANTGNSLIKVTGKLDIYHEKDLIKSYPINTITINPEDQSLLSNRINAPSFGNIQAKLNLKVEYYNAIEDKYYPLGEINQESNTYFIPWFLIIAIIALILIIIAIIISRKVALKKYLNSCEQYKVVEGDTLSTLEQKYGMNWKKIAHINNIKAPYALTPGQIIYIKNEKNS